MYLTLIFRYHIAQNLLMYLRLLLASEIKCEVKTVA